MDWAGRLAPYPSDTVRQYRASGLWGTRTVATELHEVAVRRAPHPAVVAAEGSLSYAELDKATDRLALGLSNAGLAPGDRVVVQLTNRLESIVAWYGMLKAGLIPVCTLAAHRAHEIGPISRKVGAVAHLVEWSPSGFDLVAFAVEQQVDHPTMRLVLTAGAPAGAPGTSIERLADTDPALARERVEAIQAAIDPDDIVCFQLSGGTTGVPKVIPRLHAEYWYNARSYAEAGGWDESTRVAHLIPIIHNAGITCGLHATHSVGGTLVLGTPVLDQALPVVARERTTDVLIGHGHFGIVDHPLFEEAMTAMKRVVLSGAKVPARVFEAFESRGVWVGQKFGMGEGFFTMSTAASTREARLTTVGVPVSPYDEFRVLEPGTETEVPDGAVGELACRGPYTIRGYFDAPGINSSAFTSDGFYRTGDLVAVRTVGGERSISVEGRLKDLINRGGEKVSAEEVETLLMRHPRIVAAAVVAMPDERLGERACAYLVTAGEPLTMSEVQNHLSSLSLAKFKWPERLEWIPELPRTPLGKLDKKLLQRDITAKVTTGR
ncbi:2,3-dihydroxybenzoate-AMP ligase [Acrocarpospora pleiomorpha]|uniref:2,3-dihydroxybenzoate-AMP ligase n=1 Tax=Acrocarpospora pleiomorpha TaxID=90975 RepID=A0A5M3XCY4_9ACTN|nr:AMP-binding protein [Acrocarpospora pleiomorpha]GES19074.1 2,3-dihydroxybenzoate-AMP ligase [Acrocarpospora pleiomorpha]